MTEKDYEIARLLRSRLSAKVRLVDLRVFGSRARGDAESDSDMDVFIEIDEENRQTEETIRDIAWETGFEYLIHIYPAIFSRAEIERSPMRSAPIVQNIFEEGVVV